MHTGDIREYFCTLLRDHYRAGEAKAPLKQSDLMHNVLASAKSTLKRFIFLGQDQEGERGRTHQLFQDIPNCMSATFTRFVGNDLDTMLVLKVVFQVAPSRIMPMSDENSRFPFTKGRLNLALHRARVHKRFN